MTASKAASLPRLAVLIDGDNANAAVVDGLLAEIARLGIASVKRIYGDWTRPDLASWKEILLRHAIHPVQQFAYTTGKNATDCAMIIDAMDLLYTRRFSGFCIVSSDSDFTRLAVRLREEGLSVYGFGRRNTPQALVSACDKFLYTEDLGVEIASPESPQTKQETPSVKVPPVKVETPSKQTKEVPPAKPTNTLKADTKLMNLLREATETAAQDGGWAHLGAVGNHVKKQSPDFDSKKYGHAKFRALIEATGLFDVEERSSGNGSPKSLCIRDRKRKPACGDKTIEG